MKYYISIFLMTMVLASIAHIAVLYFTGNKLTASTVALICIWTLPISFRLYNLEQKLKRLGLKL